MPQALPPAIHAPDDMIPGMPYRHYKGGAYTIMGVGRNEADMAPVVVYQADRDRSLLWVRTLDVFIESVDTPAGTQPRFAPAWRDSLACLDFLPRESVLAVLRLYDAPYRHYHDRAHVLEMFEEAARRGIALSAPQALAVLFHDAVYVPGSKLNEAASAELIVSMAPGVAKDILMTAARIVIDTQRHEASTPESAIVLDLDLMRLAAPAADFDAFTDAVFAENRPLLAAATGLEGDALRHAFDVRRAAFMSTLAARETLFVSGAFADCEAPARANLARTAMAA